MKVSQVIMIEWCFHFMIAVHILSDKVQVVFYFARFGWGLFSSTSSSELSSILLYYLQYPVQSCYSSQDHLQLLQTRTRYPLMTQLLLVAGSYGSIVQLTFIYFWRTKFFTQEKFFQAFAKGVDYISSTASVKL